MLGLTKGSARAPNNSSAGPPLLVTLYLDDIVIAVPPDMAAEACRLTELAVGDGLPGCVAVR